MKRNLLRAAGWVVTLVCFIFLAQSIWKMHPDFSRIGRPGVLALAAPLAALFAGVVFLSAAAWKMTLQFLQGGRLPYRPVADVYARANIAKYLPGNVMHFAGRNLLAAKIGLSQLDVAFSTMTEIAVLLLTACFWAAVLAARAFGTVLGRSAEWVVAHPIPVAAGAAVLAAGIVWMLVWMRRHKKLGKYRRFFTRRFLWLALRLAGIYSVTLLLPGLALAALFPVLGAGMTMRALLQVTAGYTLSWVAGYLVPGAPGGIGVRESVLLLVLTPLFPSGQVLIAAILHRIFSILGDAAAFAVLPLLRRGGSPVSAR